MPRSNSRYNADRLTTAAGTPERFQAWAKHG
jgi:hypothetical protein